MQNPLLAPFDTPFNTIPFDKIKVEHFIPALQEAIEQGKKEIQQITTNTAPATFDNTVVALEQAGSLVEIVASTLFNLNYAETTPAIQQVAREASPLLTEYRNDITLNEALFSRVKQVYEQQGTYTLNAEQTMLLEKTYKGFTRNGAKLADKEKQRLREIDKRLSEAALQFSENVLHETNDFTLHIIQEEDLAGLPDSAIEIAKMTAQERDLEGWAFTTHYPSFHPFITYADNRALRKKMYLAHMTKACKGNAHDNQALVKELVQLRHERAQLLGYTTHAAFALEERMAGSVEKVRAILQDILQYAKPIAAQQIQEVAAYAKANGLGEERLQRWDLAYYSEKLKKEKYAIDDEILRPYFPLENVIKGVFLVAEKLFNLSFTPNTDIPVYHPDVTAYEVTDHQGKHWGVFYADFFPREGKKGGAWMTSYREQHKKEGKDIRPLVSIVCNFSKPTETKPSLLTFQEVTTLFHEFGHALHGMLAEGTYQSVSGTNVYWDFVELPSQLMENWCYEKECLDLFARHFETDEPIPQELIERIKESANFLQGFATIRQLGFGFLDMAWYGEAHQQVEDVFDFESKALSTTALFPSIEGVNMSCQFNHIFAGGYAAGYYSYKWAEVLDADAFEYFKEKGIFNAEVAESFRKNILAKGGSEHPMTLYKRFRGQAPSVKPLLKRSGLLEEAKI
ncbi:MAG: M3 family metallopeptidase [Thermonemataceae bacterium]